jgi:hypothetical protein
VYTVKWKEPTSGGRAAGFRLYIGIPPMPGPGIVFSGYPSSPDLVVRGSKSSFTWSMENNLYAFDWGIIVAYNAAGNSSAVVFDAHGYRLLPSSCKVITYGVLEFYCPTSSVP